MAFRVGLVLQRSIAVIHRLDPNATRSLDPPGDPTSGYDGLLGEPITYDVGAVRTDARQELSAIRVPCQVEVPRFEDMKQFGPGIVAATVLTLVLHRQNLESAGLLDPTTRAPLIRKSDRVSAIERDGFPGQLQQPLTPPGLFVLEVRPASWGFGPEGHDLELVFLEDRARARP